MCVFILLVFINIISTGLSVEITIIRVKNIMRNCPSYSKVTNRYWKLIITTNIR